MKKILKKKCNFNLKDINEQDYTISGVFSTEDEDWHGDVIDQKGWYLEVFKANPVILYEHGNTHIPITVVGKCIDISVSENGELVGKVKFAAEEYDAAMTLFKLYAGGYMRAFSVGFINEDSVLEEGKMVLRKNTLYEISCVAVPANPMALAKSKGIDVEPIEKLLREKSEKPENADSAAGTGNAKKEDGADTEEAKAEKPEQAEQTEEQKIDKAIEVLSKKQETIRSAIGILTGLLKPEAEADTQVVKRSKTPQNAGGKKQVPVNLLINRAIKQLLAAKHL